jgi:hypothetical protein
MLKNHLCHCGHHKEPRQEAMSQKHVFSLNTQQMFLSHIHQKMNLKRKKQNKKNKLHGL